MDYRQYFEEELTEDQAIQRLDELTRDLQQRQNKLIEVVLSYPARNLGSSSVPTEKSPIPSGPVLKIQRLARALSDQALLSLHLQKPDVAFRIIECLRRLEKNFCRGTMLRSLVGLSLHRVIDSIIWEGIRLHSWDQEHLAILSNQLQQLDYSSDLEKVAKFETIFGIHSVDHLEHIAEASSQFWSEIWDLNEEMTLKEKVQIYLKTEGPDGWRGQRKAILVNDALSFLADHKNGELDYVGSRKIDPDNNNYDPFEYSRSHGETLRVYAGKLMEARTETRIALIAITAEQAYLANGSYPVSLEDLNYSFETTDAMDSKKRPLSYELDEHGKPRISSVVDPKIRWLFAPEEKKSSLRKKSRKATN